jgi:hypothetical protein
VRRFRRGGIGSARVGRFAQAKALVLAFAIAGTAGSALALLPLSPFAGSACAGSGPRHAALVVQHGSGLTIQRCVAFSSATISGDQLLELSGIEYATASFGGFGQAVCQIDNEPAQFSVCLPPSPDPYWVVFVARGRGPWAISDRGVSGQTFADGDAEGFRYDPQTGAAAPPPAPAPCPSPTPVPTATPARTSNATPHLAPSPKAPAAPTPRPPAGGASQPSSATNPPLASGAGSALALASPVAPEPAPVPSGGAPPADLTQASSNEGLATAGALLALLILAVVAVATARSRSRRMGR